MNVTELDPMETTASVRPSGENPSPVHQELAAVERGEVRRQRVAESNHSEQLVGRGIDDRNGV
jgi:hypothetical protein